jgi:hypothetical protein
VKIIAVSCLSVFLCFISIKVVAFNSDLSVLENSSITKSVIVTPFIGHTLKQIPQLKSSFEFNYISVEFNASYSDLVISNTAPLVNIKSNTQAYYLQSKISLPSSEHFNIAMTASFNQQDEKQHSFQQIPLTNSFYIIEKNQSAHYGLIGQYHLSSQWQISGGIVHSLPVLETATSEPNNLAIFGTIYNF